MVTGWTVTLPYVTTAATTITGYYSLNSNIRPSAEQARISQLNRELSQAYARIAELQTEIKKLRHALEFGPVDSLVEIIQKPVAVPPLDIIKIPEKSVDNLDGGV